MIREVIVPDKNIVSVSVPDEYIGKTVEVIAFALDESTKATDKSNCTFNALKIDTLNYRFNRDEANERWCFS
ncbi:MAG: hypothetical protein JST19_01225 [Bacteroidetes bacterium]|nr:hypothetical protein [Bacteroidota bacterium]